MFLIPLAIRVGDFSLFAPGNVGMLLGGAAVMTGMTYGLFRWNRNATPDPFEIDDDIDSLKGKEPPDDNIPIE